MLSDRVIIEPEDLPIPVRLFVKSPLALPFDQARAHVIATFEKAYVTELLRNNNGNVSQAAKAANKERRSFGRLIKKHRLEKR